MVMEQCAAQGWQVNDDNEADALAVWSYMCSLLEPRLAVRPTQENSSGEPRPDYHNAPSGA